MIDTRARRLSALLDDSGIVFPDGVIEASDRAALLGQYSGIPGGAGPSPAGIPPTPHTSLSAGGSATRLSVGN